MPVRQTLVRVIVEERALVTSALGVSAMVFNVGRMVGPAIAGVVLGYLSEAWCFVLNTVSYAGIIIALLAMRLPPEPKRPQYGAGGAQGSLPACQVLLAFPAVRYLLPTVVAVGLFATPYVPLMPSIVAHFFDGRSSTVGSADERGRRRRTRRPRPTSRCNRATAASCACMTLRATRRRCRAGDVCVVTHAAAFGTVAGSARRHRHDSASTPPTPCCSSRCPTSGAAG